jgi:hypothetical protein
MTSFGQITRQIFDEINVARTQPQVYVGHLERMLPNF